MHRRRSGFTIIEMLVSMSLIILIMSILTGAFQVGLFTFSKLKAIGDMSDKLRAAATQFRADLRCDHFEGATRVSDPNFVSQRPRQGFFFIKQFGPSGFEGSSYGPPGIGSYRAPVAPGQGHILYMTNRLRGNRQESFFGAAMPAGSPLMTTSTTFFNQPAGARFQQSGTVYMSQWAEVAYMLQPLMNQTTGQQMMADNSVPLYTLNRVVRVMITNNQQVNGQVAAAQASSYGAFSTSTGANGMLNFNSPLDVTNPAFRAFSVGGATFPQDPSTPGTPNLAPVSTLLLTDVLSFDVQVLAAPPIGQGQASPPPGFPISNTLDFSDVGTSFPATYDSSSASVGLLAIQITIRVWDLRSQQARQITILQDL